MKQKMKKNPFALRENQTETKKQENEGSLQVESMNKNYQSTKVEVLMDNHIRIITKTLEISIKEQSHDEKRRKRGKRSTSPRGEVERNFSLLSHSNLKACIVH